MYTCYPWVVWLYTIVAIFRCLYIYLSFSLDLILIDWCFQRRVYLVCVLSLYMYRSASVHIHLTYKSQYCWIQTMKLGKQMFLISLYKPCCIVNLHISWQPWFVPHSKKRFSVCHFGWPIYCESITWQSSNSIYRLVMISRWLTTVFKLRSNVTKLLLCTSVQCCLFCFKKQFGFYMYFKRADTCTPHGQ